MRGVDRRDRRDEVRPAPSRAPRSRVEEVPSWRVSLVPPAAARAEPSARRGQPVGGARGTVDARLGHAGRDVGGRGPPRPGDRRGTCRGRAADVAVAVDDRAGAARLRAGAGRGTDGAAGRRRPPADAATGGRGWGAADVAVAVHDRCRCSRAGCRRWWSSAPSRWTGRPGTAGRPVGATRRGPGRPAARVEHLRARPVQLGQVLRRARAASRLRRPSPRTRPAGRAARHARPARRRTPSCASPSARRRRPAGPGSCPPPPASVRHGPERSDIGYGEPRGRGDLWRRTARPGRAARRRGLQLGAQRAGPRHVVGVGARVAAPTIRSRSARAASISSGPSSPPTSAPRLARAVEVGDPGVELGRAARARRVVRRAGSRSTRSLIRSTCARSCRSRAAGSASAGSTPAGPAARTPARPRACMPRAARPRATRCRQRSPDACAWRPGGPRSAWRAAPARSARPGPESQVATSRS